MTDTFRALAQELVEAWDATADFDFNDFGHAAADIADRARALLANSVDQDDATLKFIREHTPRYRMSVIVSTNDCSIDTRMNVIWSALNSDTEILESVSLPEKLPPCKNS